MRTVPFPFVGGAYADESRPWSMQDTVNYLPTLAERGGTRSQAMLKTPPGLRPYTRGSTGIVRGTYNAEGKFFAVIGTTFYQVMPGGLLVSKGSVPGLGRVAFTHNQISLGNEVVVVNGSAGYVYNTVTNAFGRITDPGYPGSAVAGFIDGYILGIEPQGRYAFNSRPAAATDYNTLDRFTSEVSPDRLVTQGISNNELLLLSTTSGEFFQNTGASQQPFRSKRITIDKGCAGPYTLVDLDNSLCWLGGDGVFYRLENYTPKRISTRPIEQAIRGLDWWQAFGFVWEDSGYACAYWTFPDGRTWGWDASNGEWHRRESYLMDRWRANSMTRWNDEWYAGDFQDGMIWRVDWDYIMEGCYEFVSERTCAVMSDNQNRVRANRLELVMDTGMVLTTRHDDIIISGELPDGAVGDVVDFTYTVTTAYPGEAYSLTATGLPDGLTMDSQGHVTGTLEEAGEFEIFITGETDCGEAEHEDTVVVTEPPALQILAAPDLQSYLVYGDGATLPDDVDTGVATSSECMVDVANGSIFHWTQNGAKRATAIAGPWTDVTGLPTIAPSAMLHTGTEYLAFSYTNVEASEDGDAFTERHAGSCISPVMRGTTILGIMGGRWSTISIDAGATFTNFQHAGLAAFEGIQCVADAGTYFVIAGQNGSSELQIGRSLTGASGSWAFAAGPATAVAHGLVPDDEGNLLMVLQDGSCWISDDEAATFVEAPSVPYGGAGAYPTAQRNKMNFGGGWWYFCAEQGGGVNRIYRWRTGELSWIEVYTAPGGVAVQSVAVFA